MPAQRSVLLVGNERDWPPELAKILEGEGRVTTTLPDLAALPAQLPGRVGAIFVLARPLGATEVFALRRVREALPGIAIVVLTRSPNDSDMKRAFENGATTFLSWPASTYALREALGSGALTQQEHSRLR